MTQDIPPRAKKFALSYVEHFHEVKAAMAAGYSRATAQEAANHFLSDPDIKIYIDELIKEAEERTKVTQDRIIKEYARLAFCDPRKFFDNKGKLKHITDMDADTAATIQSIEPNKIKFCDKKAALDSLARHLGMFNDKLELTGELRNLSDAELEKLLIEKLGNMPVRVDEWEAVGNGGFFD